MSDPNGTIRKEDAPLCTYGLRNGGIPVSEGWSAVFCGFPQFDHPNEMLGHPFEHQPFPRLQEESK